VVFFSISQVTGGWAGVATGKIHVKATHMNIFYRPFYKSDITQFLEQLKTARPELQAQQQAGRALLWDKAVDRSAWSQYRAARVAQQPYVYQSHDQ
jgi:hypothetical protein